MPIIALSNQKGGVGKTTSTLNLGAALQASGKRTLLVDLDPQGNLSTACGLVRPELLSPSIGDLLVQAARAGGGAPDARAAIVRAPAGLPIIPANSQLSAAELALVSAIGRETVLQSVLAPVLADYDFVLLDCLPSLSLLVVNAFTAADGVIIPVQADYLAMQGLAQVIETITAVQRRLNQQLRIYGILMTMIDSRTSHSHEVVSTVRGAFAGQIHVFDAEIRMQVALKDSTKLGTSILDYEPRSLAARAYTRLAAEVIELASGGAAAVPARQRAVAAPPRLQGSAVLEDAPRPGGAALQANPTGASAAAAVAPPPAPARTGPLRFSDFVASRDGWLGSGD